MKRNEEEINVQALCCYCTSAVSISFLYIPGIILIWIYTGSIPTAEEKVIAGCLTVFCILLHLILPFVCCYTEIPDTKCKIGAYLVIQQLPLLWYLIAFLYIAAVKPSDEDKETKSLRILVIVILVLTMVAILLVPNIVLLLTRGSNVVCYGFCRTLKQKWRLRRAIDTSDYKPINLHWYQSHLS